MKNSLLSCQHRSNRTLTNVLRVSMVKTFLLTIEVSINSWNNGKIIVEVRSKVTIAFLNSLASHILYTHLCSCFLTSLLCGLFQLNDTSKLKILATILK